MGARAEAGSPVRRPPQERTHAEGFGVEVYRSGEVVSYSADGEKWTDAS